MPLALPKNACTLGQNKSIRYLRSPSLVNVCRGGLFFYWGRTGVAFEIGFEGESDLWGAMNDLIADECGEFKSGDQLGLRDI